MLKWVTRVHAKTVFTVQTPGQVNTFPVNLYPEYDRRLLPKALMRARKAVSLSYREVTIREGGIAWLKLLKALVSQSPSPMPDIFLL